MNQSSDSEVVAVQRRKDFEKAAPEYQKMLTGVVYIRTQNREQTEEIVQQTLFKYISVMEAENWQLEIQNEGAYLRRIAINLVNDDWRAHGKAEFVSIDHEAEGRWSKFHSQLFDQSDIENQIYFEEFFQTMCWKTILGGLDVTQKQLLLLHAVEGLKFEQIAQEVNSDIANVRYEVQKVYATVRKRVQKIFGDQGLI